MKSVGKPDAQKGHVRFDERGRETAAARRPRTAPFLDSTCLRAFLGKLARMKGMALSQENAEQTDEAAAGQYRAGFLTLSELACIFG